MTKSLTVSPLIPNGDAGEGNFKVTVHLNLRPGEISIFKPICFRISMAHQMTHVTCRDMSRDTFDMSRDT